MLWFCQKRKDPEKSMLGKQINFPNPLIIYVSTHGSQAEDAPQK